MELIGTGGADEEMEPERPRHLLKVKGKLRMLLILVTLAPSG